MIAVSIDGLRSLNSFAATGYFARNGRALDDQVIRHLQLERDLQQLPEREELAVRMSVEGYTQMEIATACKISIRTVARIMCELRCALLGYDPRVQ